MDAQQTARLLEHLKVQPHAEVIPLSNIDERQHRGIDYSKWEHLETSSDSIVEETERAADEEGEGTESLEGYSTDEEGEYASYINEAGTDFDEHNVADLVDMEDETDFVVNSVEGETENDSWGAGGFEAATSADNKADENLSTQIGVICLENKQAMLAYFQQVGQQVNRNYLAAAHKLEGMDAHLVAVSKLQTDGQRRIAAFVNQLGATQEIELEENKVKQLAKMLQQWRDDHHKYIQEFT